MSPYRNIEILTAKGRSRFVIGGSGEKAMVHAELRATSKSLALRDERFLHCAIGVEDDLNARQSIQVHRTVVEQFYSLAIT